MKLFRTIRDDTVMQENGWCLWMREYGKICDFYTHHSFVFETELIYVSNQYKYINNFFISFHLIILNVTVSYGMSLDFV